MSGATNNGGPAFPTPPTLYPDGSTCDPGSLGMTLRDYFAAKALAALIGADKAHQNRGAKAVPTLAKWSYEYADAMLKERLK